MSKLAHSRLQYFLNQARKFTIASKYIKEKHMALDNYTKMTRYFIGVEKFKNLHKFKLRQMLYRRFNQFKNNAYNRMKNDFLVYKNKFLMINNEKQNTNSDYEYLKKEFHNFKNQSDTKDIVINTNLQSIEQEYEVMKKKVLEYEAYLTDLINENTILKKNQNSNIYEHNKNIIEENGLYKQTFQQLFNLVARDASTSTHVDSSGSEKTPALQTLKLSLQSVDDEVGKIRLKSTYIINHFNKINSHYNSLTEDLDIEIKKNNSYKESLDKMAYEITHRDDLLSKVSESLKNKQFNDSIHNEDLIKENERLKIQIQNTDEVINQIKKETESLRHNDLMLKSKINELTSENNDLVKARQNSQRDNGMQNEMQKLREQNQDYLSNLENCISDLKKLKHTLFKKESVIKDISSKLEVSYHRNEELQGRIEELDTQVEQLYLEIDQSSNKDNDVKYLERELKNLNVKLNSEQRETNNWKNKHEQLQLKFNAIKSENSKMTAEVIAGSSELSELKSKYKGNKNDYDQLLEENNNLQNTFKELAGELNKLKSERAEIKNTLGHDLNLNKNKVNSLNKKVEELNNALELYRGFKEKYEDLTYQNNHLLKVSEDAQAMQRQLSNMQHDKGQVNVENDRLKAENYSMRDKIEILNNDLQKMRSEFQDISAEKLKQNNTVNKLLEEMDKYAKIISSMENKLKDEQYKYKMKEKELNDTKRRYSEIYN